MLLLIPSTHMRMTALTILPPISDHVFVTSPTTASTPPLDASTIHLPSSLLQPAPEVFQGLSGVGDGLCIAGRLTPATGRGIGYGGEDDVTARERDYLWELRAICSP